MTTIINNPGPNPDPTPVRVERTVVETDSGGWAIAVVVLLLVIAAGVIWWVHYHRAVYGSAGSTPTQSASINISVPAGTSQTPTPGAGNTPNSAY